MGETEGLLTAKSAVVGRGIVLSSYASVTDSDNDYRLKQAVGAVIGQASEHISVRQARDLRQPYAWEKRW